MKFEELSPDIQRIAASALADIFKISIPAKEVAIEYAESVKGAFVALYRRDGVSVHIGEVTMRAGADVTVHTDPKADHPGIAPEDMDDAENIIDTTLSNLRILTSRLVPAMINSGRSDDEIITQLDLLTESLLYVGKETLYSGQSLLNEKTGCRQALGSKVAALIKECRINRDRSGYSYQPK